MQRIAVFLLTLGIVLVLAPTANAAVITPNIVSPETDTNLVHEIARIVLSALGVALMTLVSIYMPRVARAIEDRLKIDLPDPLELEAQRLALRSIAYAEEWALGQAKQLGKRVLSGDKLDSAARYFREHASEQVIKWTGDKVRDLIESTLGTLRMARVPMVTAAQDPSRPGAQ